MLAHNGDQSAHTGSKATGQHENAIEGQERMLPPGIVANLRELHEYHRIDDEQHHKHNRQPDRLPAQACVGALP